MSPAAFKVWQISRHPTCSRSRRARPLTKIAGGVKQLTRVQSPVKDIELCWKRIGAVEGAMFRKNPWNKSVPRVELDQRARDARVRLDQIERLAVPASAEISGSFSRRSITPSNSSKSDK
jgi:hypothetical protein